MFYDCLLGSLARCSRFARSDWPYFYENDRFDTPYHHCPVQYFVICFVFRNRNDLKINNYKPRCFPVYDIKNVLQVIEEANRITKPENYFRGIDTRYPNELLHICLVTNVSDSSRRFHVSLRGNKDPIRNNIYHTCSSAQSERCRN